VLPNSTSSEIGPFDVAVLPVGSFEQHGPYLPLTTDTLIAAEVARRAADSYGLFLLPPVTFSCSHEHDGFPGTVSISAATLAHVIEDISEDLARGGVERLVIVNGHGGNALLTNVVQEANVTRRAMLLFPTSHHWTAAREAAGCLATTHEDMHAGEAETSILLAIAPDLARSGWEDGDCEADDRSLLTMVGMVGYTRSGVIGRPSLATAEKGRALLDALVSQLEQPLKLLRE
jgi:creatinine amidohydrolase